MPKGDFLDRAEQEQLTLDAKKELEMEMNPNIQPRQQYAQPAPMPARQQYAQPAPMPARQPYPYSYGSGVYIAPPPPLVPVANPLPVPLYYQQQVAPQQAPPAVEESSNLPVLLHH